MKKVFLNFGLLIALVLATVVFVCCSNGNKTKKNVATEQIDHNSSTDLGDMTGLTSYDEGVIINGVKWATRNVAIPGTFAAKPEDKGMFYQWNRKKPWAAEGDVVGWDTSVPTGRTWATTNDPCPEGWRLPTREEFNSLINIANDKYVKLEEKVTYEQIIQNGVAGGKFTDKATGNSIFFPATGIRDNNGSLYNRGAGYYWTKSQFQLDHDAFDFLVGNNANVGVFDKIRGLCIRCVAK